MCFFSCVGLYVFVLFYFRFLFFYSIFSQDKKLYANENIQHWRHSWAQQIIIIIIWIESAQPKNINISNNGIKKNESPQNHLCADSTDWFIAIFQIQQFIVRFFFGLHNLILSRKRHQLLRNSYRCATLYISSEIQLNLMIYLYFNVDRESILLNLNFNR